MKKSLYQFIEETKGKKIDVPWKSKNDLKGECVSLIQQYASQCLNQPAKPRGHAVDWIKSYVNEGLGHTVSDQKTGDIIVFSKEAQGKGHIAIYVDGKLYDQNNLRHDNGCAGYGDIFSWDFVTLRPNTDVIVSDPKQTNTTECDQILRVGSVVKIDKILTVTQVDEKNNLIAIKELTGPASASYHWFDPTNFEVVEGNVAQQICSVGCKVKLKGEYTVQELTKTTDWACKLQIGNRTNWVWTSPCYEIKD